MERALLGDLVVGLSDCLQNHNLVGTLHTYGRRHLFGLGLQFQSSWRLLLLTQSAPRSRRTSRKPSATVPDTNCVSSKLEIGSGPGIGRRS